MPHRCSTSCPDHGEFSAAGRHAKCGAMAGVVFVAAVAALGVVAAIVIWRYARA